MKQQLSWSEFLENHPRQTGFDCDEYSRSIIKCLLQSGYNTYDVDITFTMGNNCSDLSWKSPNSNNVYLGEIKDRYHYTSKSFDDHIVEDIKVASLVKKIKAGVASRASIFSIYTDGVIKVTQDILAPGSFIGQQTSICPLTSTLGDSTPTKKTLFKFKPDFQFYFIFNYNEETNKYNVSFSRKPFQVYSAPEIITDPSQLF